MNASSRNIDLTKVVVFSGLGIFMFFIPFFPIGVGGQALLVYGVNLVKELLNPILSQLVLFAIYSLIVFCLYAKFSKSDNVIKHYYGRVKWYSIVLYCIGAILGTMIYCNMGPASLLAPEIGGLGLGLARTVVVTITVAGMMVPFIAEFGLLEFVGTLIEPLMRPIFKVPGCASIDAVTSFVANPTVGIFFTNKLYNAKKYTTREAAAIATNFSFISLGYFAVMCQMANILDYYGSVVLSAFIISFIMALIMIRIPPISFLPDKFIDGTDQVKDQVIHFNFALLQAAYASALDKAHSIKCAPLFKRYLVDVLIFSQKIAAYILCLSVITLWLVDNTSIFNYIGIPFGYLLDICQIPNAAEIAPTMILGLAEVALPATYISGMTIATESAFFVVVVSSLQIIMFSISAVSILESDIPLNIANLIIIFFVRTLLAIPIVAVVTHFIF